MDATNKFWIVIFLIFVGVMVAVCASAEYNKYPHEQLFDRAHVTENNVFLQRIKFDGDILPNNLYGFKFNYTNPYNNTLIVYAVPDIAPEKLVDFAIVSFDNQTVLPFETINLTIFLKTFPNPYGISADYYSAELWGVIYE